MPWYSTLLLTAVTTIGIAAGCRDASTEVAQRKDALVESNAKAAKIGRIEKLLKAVQALHVIAKARVAGELSDDEVQRRTDQIIADIDDEETMQRLAVIASRTAYPQAADCKQYDDIFDYVLWEAVDWLRKSGTANSVELLEELGRLINAQAGTRIRLNEAIDAAQARIKAEQGGQPERR